MCHGLRVCNCGDSKQSAKLTVAIDIHPTYECLCVPCSPATQIETSDVVAGLLKYNSNLTKYLSTYQLPSQHPSTSPDSVPTNQEVGIDRDPHKSIVDIYNLKFLSPYDHPLPNPNKQVPLPISIETQTSPRNQQTHGEGPPQQPKNTKETKQQTAMIDENTRKLQDHMKEMAKSSRYLSNTGFKKYFGRECFENYGRENTTGVADGIVYNNYLKTFNISPHCGGNLPLTQEAYQHSLVAGDSKNYQHQKIPPTHYGSPDTPKIEGSRQKPTSKMEQIIQESEKYQEMQRKYSCDPQLNIISHCPDLIKRKKEQKPVIMQTVDRPKYYPEFKASKPNQPLIPAIKKPGESDREGVQILSNRNRIEQKETVQLSGLEGVSEIGKDNLLRKGQGRQPQQGQQMSEGWERRERQKQLIAGCYGDLQMAKRIASKSKPQCSLCRQRRFTRCCCGN